VEKGLSGRWGRLLTSAVYEQGLPESGTMRGTILAWVRGFQGGAGLRRRRAMASAGFGFSAKNAGLLARMDAAISYSGFLQDLFFLGESKVLIS
jgi:hypothetical protein